jgi:formylglycine-generating enzyme required for sulfatase activity
MGARVAVWVAVVCLMTAGTASAVVMETVPVGNPGNAADGTGYGAVASPYNIGKYEVTAGQYTEFLNKVAVTDTYGLYNTSMSRTDFGSGITRSGSSGSYSYSVDATFVNRPVNYVSYWDSCRFANWLHNGQPSGVQGNSTTEDGAYTLTAQGMTNNTVNRNGNWKWAVTSEDEWYKAAYHQPAAQGGDADNYWLYPTASNSVPGRDMSEATNPGNNANYNNNGDLIGSPYYRTPVGEFELSDSPYGTFDQGGNVWEWNEAILYSSYRVLRGGSFYYNGGYLRSSYRNSGNPAVGYDGFGFRVSQVPVPGDVDGDGHVDVVDLLYLVDAFGSVTGDANYDPRCDFNSDGGVDVVDLLIMVENFGV